MVLEVMDVTKSTDYEEIVKGVLKGEIRLYQIERMVDDDANMATEIRRLVMERLSKKELSYIGQTIFDFNKLLNLNIENPIGSVQIPVGIAGPLKVKGDFADSDYHIPLCTSEGALVASVNRGCSALSRSGGVRSKVIRDQITRAPVFTVESVVQAYDLAKWVENNFARLTEIALKADPHCHLKKVDPYIVGNNIFLRFSFFTDDAMGMNMATIACEEFRRLIEREFPVAKCVALSGNLCVDKKPSAINLIQGRGKTVVSEATIRKQIVNEVMKTTPEAVSEVNYRKNCIGSALAGSYGFNAHFANIIAAIFLATGQDAAQIVESSMGITTAEVTKDGDLYISVTLPSLEVGTVGGGTRLPTQGESLDILGCRGGGTPPGFNAKKLAEIIGGAVLAGELSLLSALAAQHLAEAHIRLGRRGVRGGIAD
jgi:hydroxymethylglutaryl-CoA reductase (NADPH)